MKKQTETYSSNICTEKGAGALAGPVVAAAVQLLPPATILHLNDLDDSKKLSRKKRERLFDQLNQLASVEISIATVSAREVDEINVLQARLKAMSAAVRGLSESMPRILFVDGDRTFDGIDESIEQRAIVGGDAQVSVVAAASIIAKVRRDSIMYAQASVFPQYGFDRHVGYATKKHLEALQLYGPCPLHRFSYKPVANSQTTRSSAADVYTIPAGRDSGTSCTHI